MIFKVISGSMTKVTCSMAKEELRHFHLVTILLVKNWLRSHLHFAPFYGRDYLMFSFYKKLKPLSSNITIYCILIEIRNEFFDLIG